MVLNLLARVRLRPWLALIFAFALAGLQTGCKQARSGLEKSVQPAVLDSNEEQRARSVLEGVKSKVFPDLHSGVYRVGLGQRGSSLVLTGYVTDASAAQQTIAALRKAGLAAEDRVELLPAAELGEPLWGISCLSVASGRENPEHKAEMGTQVLLGDSVRVWKRTRTAWIEWYLVQSRDGYVAWLEEGTFVRCTKPELDAWQNGPLWIVTALEDRILERPEPGAESVSDVVIGNLVKKTGQSGEWLKVELPDRRSGFLPSKSLEERRAWQASRSATPENIERSARLFLGRPYLWGGNSPKGLDCSGFTKIVYFMNGVDLDRNASHQAKQGSPVRTVNGLGELRKGDLLFFGTAAGPVRPERVRHVGIYLGDNLFIHSSERVRISSLDPASPIRDENRIRTLLYARRILK